METTEKIVEAYVRYVRRWATIPNITCAGQFEIDLLAIDPIRLERYHIESGVSVSGSYSALTAKPYDPGDLKIRVKIAGTRRTLGYFIERKFGSPSVLARLAEYGFQRGNYSKVIVTWGWTEEAAQKAKSKNVILWDFRDLIDEIAEASRHQRSHFTDDTIRTLQLYMRAMGHRKQSVAKGRVS
jgi:hypothetical protein